MNQLDLESLPVKPQRPRLARVAVRIWENPEIIALWLGGSLAAGKGDRYSDVDLRAAVSPGSLDLWRTPDFETLFEGECIWQQSLNRGESSLLYHLLLRDGEIYDLCIQTPSAPVVETVIVIGCRDEAFSRRLDHARPESFPVLRPDPTAIREAIASFWISSHKHRKVLHRGLYLVALTGLESDRSVLLRLWYVLAAGEDIGGRRPTIHSLTGMNRAIADARGPGALEILGAPNMTPAQICRSIEMIRDEVAAAGRELSRRLGFDYPTELEETARSGWNEFLHSCPAMSDSFDS